LKVAFSLSEDESLLMIRLLTAIQLERRQKRARVRKAPARRASA
jgi:hypothetical protein